MTRPAFSSLSPHPSALPVHLTNPAIHNTSVQLEKTRNIRRPTLVLAYTNGASDSGAALRVRSDAVRRWLGAPLLLMLFAAAACRAGGRSVAIATTTSVDGSGLLQAIRGAFEKQKEIQLNAFVVGSGRALVVAAQGKVDVTITHDPAAERE